MSWFHFKPCKQVRRTQRVGLKDQIQKYMNFVRGASIVWQNGKKEIKRANIDSFFMQDRVLLVEFSILNN